MKKMTEASNKFYHIQQIKYWSDKVFQGYPVCISPRNHIVKTIFYRWDAMYKTINYIEDNVTISFDEYVYG